MAPRGCYLSVVQPVKETICRYAEEALCLVSNSTATPPGGVTAEVVVRHGHASNRCGGGNGRPVPVHRPARGNGRAAARRSRHGGVISDCISPAWLVAIPPVRGRRMLRTMMDHLQRPA